jgi:hypothetical protein
MASRNFGRTSVAIAPLPATSGLTLIVTTGTGANRLGTGRVVLCPYGVDPTPENAEIAEIASVVGDAITLSARALEGTTARPVDTGWQVIQGLTAGELDNLLRKGLNTLPDSLTQLLRVEIPDDGSDSSTWPDRLVNFYDHPTEGLTRTGYFNEFGEIRSRAAKATTVAGRIMAHANNTTTPIFQVTDDLQSALYLSVSKLGGAFAVPISAPNVPIHRVRTTDAAPINNSTALVTDDVMQFAGTAGTHLIEGAIFYDVAAAADLKLRFNYSGTGTGTIAGNALTSAATTSATNQSNHAARSVNDNFVLGGFGVGSIAACAFRGVLILTGSGTFSIQYAQNALDVSDLIIRTGSHLSHRQISTP